MDFTIEVAVSTTGTTTEKGNLLESGLIKHIYTTDSLGHDILFNEQITFYGLREII